MANLFGLAVVLIYLKMISGDGLCLRYVWCHQTFLYPMYPYETMLSVCPLTTFLSIHNRAIARTCDAKLDAKNGGEAKDWKKSRPIRVIRSYKGAKHSSYAPEEGIRYDGLYKVSCILEILESCASEITFNLGEERK